MKKSGKRIVTAVLAAALLMTTVLTPVQAATKTADMKAANVSWDLKAGKKITPQTYVAGCGYKNLKAEVKNLKVSDAKKKGYKKLTFSIVFESPTLTQKDVDKIFASKYMKDGVEKAFSYCYTLVDYETGQCLEVENDKDVTCTSTGFEHINEISVDSSDARVFYYYKKSQVKELTVIYPENYKNLCLVVGGFTKNNLVKPEKDADFWSGTGKFSKTSLCDKNNKKVAHAMRIK